MKKLKIFLDTNILISGIFFHGLESTLLKIPDVLLITSDVNYQEVVEVVRRKFKKLHREILKIALEEVGKAFEDIKIVSEREWKTRFKEADEFLSGNDQKILAAVLFAEPDYFVTGDEDFHKPEIKKSVRVVKTRELLKELGVL